MGVLRKQTTTPNVLFFRGNVNDQPVTVCAMLTGFGTGRRVTEYIRAHLARRLLDSEDLFEFTLQLNTLKKTGAQKFDSLDSTVRLFLKFCVLFVFG